LSRRVLPSLNACALQMPEAQVIRPHSDSLLRATLEGRGSAFDARGTVPELVQNQAPELTIRY